MNQEAGQGARLRLSISSVGSEPECRLRLFRILPIQWRMIGPEKPLAAFRIMLVQ
jgi:hypothetical protein